MVWGELGGCGAGCVGEVKVCGVDGEKQVPFEDDKQERQVQVQKQVPFEDDKQEKQVQVQKQVPFEDDKQERQVQVQRQRQVQKQRLSEVRLQIAPLERYGV